MIGREPNAVQLPSNVHQIRLPMAGNPLRHINGYLFMGDGGAVLVDCGWDTPDVLDMLQVELGKLGLDVVDLKSLVVTHFHPDHYGLAGRLVRTSNVQLLMHRLDWESVRNYLVDVERNDRASDAWFARNGFEATARSNGAEELGSLRRYTIVEPDRQLEDGAVIAIGPHALSVVWTPGHSPGHICLHDARRKFLLSGDHILDPITPHVGVWRDLAANPLREYLASLRKVKALDADLVLPAHGEPFIGLGRRVDALLDHHEERAAAIIAAIGTAKRSGAQIAAALPWTSKKRPFAQLSPFHQEFALAETLAHLVELQARGSVERTDADGRVLYQRT